MMRLMLLLLLRSACADLGFTKAATLKALSGVQR